MIAYLIHIFTHQWLSIKRHNGNYVCRDCPRMRYDGPFGDGLEDYRVGMVEWRKYFDLT